MAKMLSRGTVAFVQWRRGAGLSQEKAAQLIGVSTSLISKIEQGHRRPGLRLAVRFERATRIRPVQWLLPASEESVPC